MIVHLAQHFDPQRKLSFAPLSDYESECMQWTLWGVSFTTRIVFSFYCKLTPSCFV